MMAAGKKKDTENPPGTPTRNRSLRNTAEEQLAGMPKGTERLNDQTPEQLVHELRVHQIELEMQAEELRRAHLALEESRDLYLDLYEFAPLGYLSLNRNAVVTSANLTAVILLGTERRDLLMAPLSKFMSGKDADLWHRYFTGLVKQEGKQVCSLTLTRSDGSLFPARLEAVRLTGNDGAVTVRVAISDITDICEAHEALRVSNRKLNLLSSVTRHDINNQLLTLNGFLELLHESVPDPQLEHYFSRITTASDRIAAMIRFTREYEQLGVNAPVWQDCRTVVDTAARQAPLGIVRVKNDLPYGMEVFADPLIEKVCYNLMDNAVKHGSKCTTIRFSAMARNGDHVVICEDDGDGVPAADKELIFDRGFGRDNGLGLSLAREILEITGITIRETGEPGRGARFEMTVPKGMWRTGGAGTTGN